jgi:hypothetical protein
MLFVVFCTVGFVPPTGAQYGSHISIPFIGQQHIQLDIVTKKLARINLSGIISMEENLNYHMTKDNKLEFSMSGSLEKVLNKYFVKIHTAEYDPKSDTASICVFVKPIHFKKKVSMPRLQKKTQERPATPRTKDDLFFDCIQESQCWYNFWFS